MSGVRFFSFDCASEISFSERAAHLLQWFPAGSAYLFSPVRANERGPFVQFLPCLGQK